MDYIILNGISSETVPGIEIKTLPTIMKPAMRTQVEEIDGKSGNFVFPIGYAAYTRSFQIIIKDFSYLDEIISFFNSEGTAIFSNEPDKYYRYMITEPIVFEPITTIEMRVQPFKYSTIDGTKVFSFENQLINLRDYEKIQNGLTVKCVNNEITITGIATDTTDIMLRTIGDIKLKPGLYDLEAFITGDNTAGVSVQIVKESAGFKVLNDMQITFMGSESIMKPVQITSEESYDCLCLSFVKGYIYKCKIEVWLNHVIEKQINICNRGNHVSRPKITVYGLGDINININNEGTLDIYLPKQDYIIIDTEIMEAYKGEILKNRDVKGDYDKLFFVPGNNTMNVSGNIKKIEIENFSRWI